MLSANGLLQLTQAQVNWESVLDSLVQKRNVIESSLDSLAKISLGLTLEIDSVNKLIALKAADSAESISAAVGDFSFVRIYEEPDLFGRQLGMVRRNDAVTVIGYAEPSLVFVKYEEKFGFIETHWLQKTDQLAAFLQKLKQDCERKAEWISVEHEMALQHPHEGSEHVVYLELGDKVYVQKRIPGWSLVRRVFGTKQVRIGWIPSGSTTNEELTDVKVNQIRLKKKEHSVSKAFPDISQRLRNLIVYGDIEIGMTKEMVLFSWGYPVDVNRTVTASNVHEQWVYGDLWDQVYLYFDNGILTTYQD